jgi:ADP-ribose pyrophosphatase
MTPKPWKTLSSRQVYQNPWIRVREDTAELPDDRTTLYGVVEIGDAVGVLPFLDEDHVVMVRQYRYVFGEDQRWEIPTGATSPGETFVQAAHRELREETSFDARILRPISTFYTSKSVVYEIAHLFIGHDLVKVSSLPDETEFLEVEVFPFGKILEMVLQSEIRDAMTIIAVQYAALNKRSF